MHGKKKIGVEHVPRVEPSWRVSSIVCRPGTGERVCGACIRVDERGVVGGRDMARLWAPGIRVARTEVWKLSSRMAGAPGKTYLD